MESRLLVQDRARPAPIAPTSKRDSDVAEFPSTLFHNGRYGLKFPRRVRFMESLSLHDRPPGGGANHVPVPLPPSAGPQQLPPQVSYLPPCKLPVLMNQMFTTAAQLLDLTDSMMPLFNPIRSACCWSPFDIDH